jgi:hypothetical protein
LSNLKKLITTDLIHGLLRQNNVGEVVETSSDRIGALAFADKLGSLLWRLRWANDAAAFEPAVELLAKRCRGRRATDGRRHLVAVCRLALEEWLDDQCRKCGGRGHTINKGVKHACAKCDATGTRRHSDAERMRQLHMDRKAYSKAEETFADAHTHIASADSQTWRDPRGFARTYHRQGWSEAESACNVPPKWYTWVWCCAGAQP